MTACDIPLSAFGLAMKHLIPTLIVLSCTFFPMSRLAAAETSPESVAQAYLAARSKVGFKALCDFVHPEAAEQFKQMILDFYVLNDREAERMRFQTFGVDATRAAVRSLNAVEFTCKVSGSTDAEFRQRGLKIDRGALLGTVNEGDITHVLVRTGYAMADDAVTELETLSLKRDAGRWKLLLPVQWQRLHATSKAMVERMAAARTSTNFDADESRYVASRTFAKVAEVCVRHGVASAARFDSALARWRVAHQAEISRGEASMRAEMKGKLVGFDVLAQNMGNSDAEYLTLLSPAVRAEKCQDALTELDGERTR